YVSKDEQRKRFLERLEEPEKHWKFSPADVGERAHFAEYMNAYERYLGRQGVLVRKFFLHVSKEEQRRRFLERLEKPEKNWKFSPADVGERARFTDYMSAYDDMIRHTATQWAPWHVVPADRKWFTRLIVSAIVIDAMQSLDPRFPEVDAATRAEFKKTKAALEAEAQRSQPPVRKK
ncbi:MAG TPA: hypothetical protein VFV51_18810, partial [Vicinamibacterales bacterium]|nr:hypothetical protein [Vicinamibacterales bacterium]